MTVLNQFCSKRPRLVLVERSRKGVVEIDGHIRLRLSRNNYLWTTDRSVVNQSLFARSGGEEGAWEVGVGERGGRCEMLGGSRARVRARVGRVSSEQLVAVRSGGG